jgi:hypothetical protein
MLLATSHYATVGRGSWRYPLPCWNEAEPPRSGRAALRPESMRSNCTIWRRGNRSMADDLKRVVVWKSLVINGTDYCALWHTAEGWLLKGTTVATDISTAILPHHTKWMRLSQCTSYPVQPGTKLGGLDLASGSHSSWKFLASWNCDLHHCASVLVVLKPNRLSQSGSAHCVHQFFVS